MKASSAQTTLQQIFDDWLREVEKDLHKRGQFWTPTLVTHPAESRTVVLRGLDAPEAESSVNQGPSLPRFVIHTDTRSKKWEQLQHAPTCGLHFYCAKRKWQMRVDGFAELHANDAYAESEWQALSERSQKIYALKHMPGEPVDDPEKAYCFEDSAQAYKHFGVIYVRATHLESLQLERPDRTNFHIRAAWKLETQALTYLAP
jgi:pyridoxine/pyridoxamine 5'-phosphate oxidase